MPINLNDRIVLQVMSIDDGLSLSEKIDLGPRLVLCRCLREAESGIRKSGSSAAQTAELSREYCDDLPARIAKSTR
jgi:hypothetical protein